MRYYVIPVRVAIINKSTKECWHGCREKGTLMYCWWWRLVENSMEGSQKIKNGTVLWPRDSTSGNIAEETQNNNSKEYMLPYVHCSTIYNSQDLGAAQVSISRWVDKKAVVHLHKRILLGHKKEGNLTICDSLRVLC